MPIVTVVKENKGGRHVRGTEGTARGQQGGVKAQDDVEQDAMQLSVIWASESAWEFDRETPVKQEKDE
jgi:hypothetical protein